MMDWLSTNDPDTARNDDSGPCFVTKPAIVATNSTSIGVIWNSVHVDSDFWGPSDEFMVEKSIDIEKIDFNKNVDVPKIDCSVKNRYPGMEYG